VPSSCWFELSLAHATHAVTVVELGLDFGLKKDNYALLIHETHYLPRLMFFAPHSQNMCEYKGWAYEITRGE